MRILLSLLIMVFFSLSQAQAAKFGGGKSFGYKKPIQYRALGVNRPKPSNKAAPAAQQRPQAATGHRRNSMLGGMLGGLLAGGLLAALFFGGAFEGMAPGDWLLIALLAAGLWFFFRHRARQQQMQTAYAPEAPEASALQQRATHISTSASSPSTIQIGAKVSDSEQVEKGLPEPPAWFDQQSFAASAVENFLAVQKAWDSGDIETLKSYCAPACFTEIAQAIKAGVHHTEVEDVHADIIDWDYDGEQFVVSVRFSGFMKENGGPARGFTEVWHLGKPLDGQGAWKILGVQQL